MDEDRDIDGKKSPKGMTMTVIKSSIILAAVVLGGCTSSEGVVLRDASGFTMRCGPFMSFTMPNQPAEEMRKCVESFQSPGYKRVPGS
jgi:hypothetical protein